MLQPHTLYSTVPRQTFSQFGAFNAHWKAYSTGRLQRRMREKAAYSLGDLRLAPREDYDSFTLHTVQWLCRSRSRSSQHDYTIKSRWEPQQEHSREGPAAPLPTIDVPCHRVAFRLAAKLVAAFQGHALSMSALLRWCPLMSACVRLAVCWAVGVQHRCQAS